MKLSVTVAFLVTVAGRGLTATKTCLGSTPENSKVAPFYLMVKR